MNKLLKAAKGALDKKDYEGVLKFCQDVFSIDDNNYNGHVFSGLANLQLGHHDDSRRHYRRAIELQPNSPLAWKGLADFYDKHRPVVQEERLDALNTFTKLLTYIQSNPAKVCSILLKMASLHKELSQTAEVLCCYSRILATTSEGMELPADTLVTMATFMFGMREFFEETWYMLVKVFDLLPDGDSKTNLRPKFIERGMTRFKAGATPDGDLQSKIISECELLLSVSPELALPTLLQITLWEAGSGLLIYDPSDVSLVLPSNQRGWCEQLLGLPDEAVSLTCTAGALVGVADGKWTEAKTLAEKALTAPSVLCETYLIACVVYLRLHDYQAVEQAALKGLKVLPTLPKFVSPSFERLFKLCLLHMAIGLKDDKQAITLSAELSQVMSGDCHMTALTARASLLGGHVDEAKEVCITLEAGLGGSHILVQSLLGEISLLTGDYTEAVDRFSSALDHTPNSSSAHFLKGVALWRSKFTDKRPAYSCFIQAAKLDPYNAEAFLYIGRYQKQVNNDLKRAAKCFQKAVDLRPSLTEAAMELGDILMATGEEENAFELFDKICSNVPPDKAKQAWLRSGLYHQSKGSCNDAIRCFQTYLGVEPKDVQCWECLGDSYLARGSHSSALKAFTKCLELCPSSLYCLYQLASIKRLLGQLSEAVIEYTAVLDSDTSYVPALTGRGETHLQLAREALTGNFDENAVDHISLALRDLTYAAHLRPMFVCVWKLIGDSCLCLRHIPMETARPNVPVVLKGQSTSYVDDCTLTDKKSVIEIGCRAYSRALQLSPNSAHLWHDLALSHYYLGMEMDRTGSDRSTHLNTALSAVKKAVSLCPHDHLYWNTLGLVAACPDVNNIALAQHAFIKSILEDSNNAVAWTNLGVLYFQNDHIKLAHEAFTNAQSLSPDYVQAWIGQALVAETIGNTEAMDLFRHTTELGYHPEGALGYAYWVCHTLHSIDPKLILSSSGCGLNTMATKAVLQARDCLQKYVRRVKGYPCAFNYLGLLFEQEGIVGQAEKNFQNALDIGCGTVENVNSVRANLARSLSANGRPSAAVRELVSLPQDDLKHRLQLALALGKLEKFQESYKVYDVLLSEDGGVADEDRSAILTAQAMMAFAMGDGTTAKTQLFKSFQCSPVCVHGLVAMCVLGCLSNDLTLTQAALQEIIKLLDSQPDTCSHLHPSCLTALATMACILGDQPEACECVDAVREVTSRLATPEQYTMPSPLPLTLHSLRSNESSPKETLSQIQKLLHTYPTDVWVLSSLSAFVEQPELKEKYQDVILCHVDNNLLLSANLPEEEKTLIVKNMD